MNLQMSTMFHGMFIHCGQCDQIGAKFRHLGQFLQNQFSLKQSVSTHGLSKGLKSN
jgi:hypothetical protein